MSITSTDRVSIDVSGGVADVRLNRPDKLNSLDPEMMRELGEAGRALAADHSLRVVVLHGEGRAFCSGLDFASFQAFASRDRHAGDGGANGSFFDRRDSPANGAQLAAWVWTELPVPVIAAIHGYAFGGGLQIALGADIRIVAPNAQLSVMEVKWGLIPDMSGTQTLRHLVRLDVAKELTYTGRIVSGSEAVELGLATRVAEDPLTEARKLASSIAQKSPHAIRSAKKLFNASVTMSVRDGLVLEEELQRALIGSPNQIEAVRANFEKRAPVFADPE
ncbi:MAG TPA: crotonase/enoyl-CoA hydratase family protein [Thermoanaerobaculia bacterium]|nr:crotonase/enoyl-CoA hydratase family protein [Thermoanaerobaculia bacterium]